MTAPKRIAIILAFSFLLGAGFARLGVSPVLVTLCAIPLGAFSWFWILSGDVMRPWAIFTREGRTFMGPILAGHSNLGSATTMRLSVVGEMIRVLQALALGFMLAILLGVADTVAPTALLSFVGPLIAWWVFKQIQPRA